jgi:hypothetical protein
MERKSGIASQAGNDIRARYRERVEARLKGDDELARVLQRQKEKGRKQAIERFKQKEGLPKKTSWSALTREELNQKGRERYKAKKEALNRAQQQKEAEQKTTSLSQPPPSPTAGESARNWLALSESGKQDPAAAESVKNWLALSEKQGPTAAESRRNWLAYRESQGPDPTSEESRRNWLAYRESQKQADPSHDRSHAHEVGGDGTDDEKNTDRGRDYDAGL